MNTNGVPTLTDKEALDKLLNLAMRCIYEFEEFLLLFYPAKQVGKKQVELLNATAKHFFGTLYYQTIDRIVLSVIRISEDEVQLGHQNLTIKTLHSRFSTNAKYPKDKARDLIVEMRNIAGSVKSWRHWEVVHFPLVKTTKDKFNAKHIQDFYAALRKYLDLVYSSVYGEPCNISTPGYFGVAELLKAIRYGHSVRMLLETETRLADAIIRNDLATVREVMAWRTAKLAEAGKSDLKNS